MYGNKYISEQRQQHFFTKNETNKRNVKVTILHNMVSKPNVPGKSKISGCTKLQNKYYYSV